MRNHATFWLISTVLLGACAQGVDSHEVPRKPTAQGPVPTGSPTVPYNVTPPGSGGAGSGGQTGKGGASSSNAGNAGSAGSAGSAAAGGTAGGPPASGAAGAPAAGGVGNSVGTGSSGAGANNTSMQACPSLTRARLPSGQCVDRVTEFSVASAPTSITTGSDGRVWFDDGIGHQLVQLDDQGHVLNRVPCDAAESQRELVGGSGDAILWYTDSQAQTVSKLAKNLQVTAYALGFAPVGLALAASDQVWVTEMNQAVYRMDATDTPTITGWDASPSNTIIVGPDQNLWFPDNVTVAKMTPAGDRQDYTINDSFIDDICAGPDGALWFTDGTLHQIGRMEVYGVLSRTYDLPLGTKPFQIIAGPDGALWFTEQAAGNIGRISVQGVITHYPVPTANAMPYAITVGSDHNLWFTEHRSGKVGRLIPDPLP